MTDVKLEDAERVAETLDRAGFGGAFSRDDLLVAASLLRKLPELNHKLKEHQEWASLRHNELEQHMRDQVDKRVELHRQLSERTAELQRCRTLFRQLLEVQPSPVKETPFYLEVRELAK